MDDKLRQIYRQIPRATCTSGCGECCGVISPSLAEIRAVKEYCAGRGIDFREFTDVVGADCPYLTTDRCCEIYPVRPFLCRLLGAAESLPCPLGRCTCGKPLKAVQASHLYAQVYLHGKEKRRTEAIRSRIAPVLRHLLAEDNVGK